MARAIAVVVVLSLGSLSFGAPVLEIDVASAGVFSREIGGSTYPTFEFNVVLAGVDGIPATGDLLIDNLTGICLGANLNGAGTAGLTYVNEMNSYWAHEWDTVITGADPTATYQWAAFDSRSYSGKYGDLITHVMLDDRCAIGPPPFFEILGVLGTPAVQGSVVARFIWEYDGVTPIPINSITVHLAMDDTSGNLPYLLGNPGPIYCDVANQDATIPIPEPATTGLLGLGVVGLVARRRKRK